MEVEGRGAKMDGKHSSTKAGPCPDHKRIEEIHMELRRLRRLLPSLVKLEVQNGFGEGIGTSDYFQAVLEQGYVPVLADGFSYYCTPPDYQDRLEQALPKINTLLAQLRDEQRRRLND
jgi:hypothetical protein